MTINNILLDKPEEIEVISASALTSGHGHKKITVSIYHDGSSKEFHSTVRVSPYFDQANNLEGEDKYQAFYQLIEDDIANEIAEWIVSK